VETGKTQEQLAELAGVSGAEISLVKNHARGAGWNTAEGLAEAFGLTLDQLKQEAAAAYKERPQSIVQLRAVQDGEWVSNGSMPGWEETEIEARKQLAMPEWVSTLARRRPGLIPRGGVTIEYVLNEILGTFRYAPHDQALSRTNEEFDQKVAELRKPKRKKR